MNIFVDTGAFYALADTTDRYHDSARAYYAEAMRPHQFFTSSFVLVETWLLIRNKLGYSAAQKFFEGIRKGIVTVVDVSGSDLDKAGDILSEYADQEFSLVDAVSFTVMERLGISTAFSFDSHYSVYRYGAKKKRKISVVP
jgi:predicted nucleic acid-binding protein